MAAFAMLWPVMGLAASGHSTAAAANSATFTDPAGDSGSAPDITTVTVANDDAGVLTLTLAVPNRTAFADTDGIRGLVDTDSNPGTGAPGGWDYEFGWIQGAAVLSKWSGAEFDTISAPSFKGAFKDSTATASVALADIGSPTAFNLFVTATGDGGDSFPELAPDTGAWGYSTVATVPPPPPPPAPPPPPGGTKLTASRATVGSAQAGKAFTVSMTVKDASTKKGVKGTLVCAGKLGRKAIKAARKSSVAKSGKATCVWQLPKSSRGKQIKGSIIETYKGAKVSRSFSKRVS